MIEKFINTQRIKYAILDTCFTEEIMSNEKSINFYFDMHTVMSSFYRKNVENIDTAISDDNIIELTASIFNLIAHYRKYFHKYHKMDNRIFLIINRKIPEYNSKSILYGNTFFDKYSKANSDYAVINHIYDKTITILKELVKGFKWVYVIDSERIEDTATIKYLAEKYDGMNVIYSKTDLLYQLVNDDFYIFRPSWDKSVLLSKKNMIEYYFEDVKYTPEYMTAEILPVYQTILGVKSRNIDSINIRGKVKLAQIFEKMLSKGIMKNSVSIKSFIDIFMVLNETTDGDFYDILYDRFCAISANMAHLSMTDTEKMKIDMGLIDTYHKVSIEELNDELKIKDKIDTDTLLHRCSMKKRGLFD